MEEGRAMGGYDPAKVGAAEAPLTKGERAVLAGAARCARFGWNFTTGRRARKANAIRLIKRGLIADAGLSVMVDGDGFALEPERYRQCYALTKAGHAAHARLERGRGKPCNLATGKGK